MGENKHIHITFEPCNEIFQGRSVVADDGSMIYRPLPPIGSFSVYLYHWTFEITTSTVTENKYKFEYLMGSLDYLKYETVNLIIPDSFAGHVYVEVDFPHADGLYYSEFEQFCKRAYFDPEKRIVAVGDIYGDGRCIEFAKGQYVVIDDFNRLISAYSLMSN